MSLSTAVLGWAINTEHFAVASAGIIAFVVSFAIGLGPVPFVLVGELPPKEVRPLPARPSLLSLLTPPRALADPLTNVHHPLAGKLGDRLDRRRRQLAEQPRRRDRLPPPARLARRLARQERQRLLPLYSAHGARRRCSLSARAVTRWRSLSSSRRDVSESGCGRSRSRTALWAAALPTTDKSCSAFRHASELETVERARAEAVQTQLGGRFSAALPSAVPCSIALSDPKLLFSARALFFSSNFVAAASIFLEICPLRAVRRETRNARGARSWTLIRSSRQDPVPAAAKGADLRRSVPAQAAKGNEARRSRAERSSLEGSPRRGARARSRTTRLSTDVMKSAGHRADRAVCVRAARSARPLSDGGDVDVRRAS